MTYPHGLLIRLPFAASFLYHGAGKLIIPVESAAMLDLPVFLTIVVGIGEVLAGIGAIAGGFPGFSLRRTATRLTGLAAAPILLGAIATVHWPKWSFPPSESHPIGGMEFQVLLLGIALWFLITGGEAPAAGTGRTGGAARTSGAVD